MRKLDRRNLTDAEPAPLVAWGLYVRVHKRQALSFAQRPAGEGL
jgi:hypothetical protein